jgi:hypothetical protein
MGIELDKITTGTIYSALASLITSFLSKKYSCFRTPTRLPRKERSRKSPRLLIRRKEERLYSFPKKWMLGSIEPFPLVGQALGMGD